LLVDYTMLAIPTSPGLQKRSTATCKK